MGRALIVEDEFLLAIHAETILRGLGFGMVEVAEDGGRAAEIVGSRPLDVVLLDLHLGNGDASADFLDVCAQHHASAIIASTEREVDLPLGFQGLPRLLKPYGDAQVKDAIENIMASQRGSPESGSPAGWPVGR